MATVLVTVHVFFEDRWSADELQKIIDDFGEDGDGEFLGWLGDQVTTDPAVNLVDYDILNPDDIAEDEEEDDSEE